MTLAILLKTEIAAEPLPFQKGAPLGTVKACLFSDRFGHVGLCRNPMVLARICVIKPVAFESGTLDRSIPWA
jgi:hypothetical protein